MKTAVIWLFLAGLASSSCNAREGGGSAARVEPIYDRNGRLQELRYDPDGDGDVDTRTFMNGNRPLRSLVDTDRDGTVDRWEYYAPDGKVDKVGTSSANDGVEDTWTFQGPSGLVLRIERSARRDGTISRREAFVDGVLASAEEDSNGDGHVDRWETYVDRSLAVLAFDTTRSRGVPDRRLVYSRDGELERIEEDPDGDGTFTPRALKPETN